MTPGRYTKHRAGGRLRIVFLFVYIVFAALLSFGQKTKVVSARLSAADKEELAEALQLKAEVGDEVWPGFGPAEIPVVLYDENSEFLTGEENPPPPWQAVEDDDFSGKRYFRRDAAKPQSFAVQVGKRWAGSISTLEYMSSRIPLKLGRDFHIAVLLHEVFHAFQATRAPRHFREALAIYSVESGYPFKDAEFSAAWSSEGQILAEAIQATELNQVSDLGRKFLDRRDARRKRTALAPELISFERELEWLEGLAKYAEVRFYELEAARAAKQSNAKPRPAGISFWLSDLALLRTRLGAQSGDLRFYLSGMAEARMLDRVSPVWKPHGLDEGSYQEDILRAALASKQNP